MKNIKTLLIAGLLISTSSVFAQQKSIATKKEKKTVSIVQQKDTPEERAKLQTKKMTKELNLTDEQVEKVAALNLKVEQKIQAIIDGEMSEERKKEFIEGNKNEKMKVLSTILTKEQMKKYRSSISNM